MRPTALTLPGVAVVVSPLIALQRDQADAINEAAGRVRAYVLNSTQAQGSIDEAWAAAESPDETVRAKFLFLAPGAAGAGGSRRSARSTGCLAPCHQ